MIELLPTLTAAIGLSNKIREISDKLKHAELKELLGDMRLQLADVKIGMADLIEENDTLKRQLASIQNAEGDECPKCRARKYHLEKSEPHPSFGKFGGSVKTYLCDSCGFTEKKTIMPGQ